MEGLTSKVFRTYNASMKLQEQLGKLTDADEKVNAKVWCVSRSPDTMIAIDGTTLSITSGATFAQCWAMLPGIGKCFLRNVKETSANVFWSVDQCLWVLRLAARPVLFSFGACAQSALWTKVHKGLGFLQFLCMLQFILTFSKQCAIYFSFNNIALNCTVLWSFL